ncbi:23S rRNA (pseudouridine(1915)-N(3))-methyltransferase RlmH [bacterium]|nr:23S rRNA (pseudouridine(1915)-N(3))-methyltransferase RlmH [bacterium]
MKITILAVGKIKEKYFAEAIKEYAKRLSRYATLNIIEVADEQTPDSASPALEAQIKQREGERLIKALKGDTYTIALALDGQAMDSPALAHKIEELGVRGHAHLAFLIGGSLGLSDQVLQRADLKLSFSQLTFPHQLMRVILLEQIYRSFRIIKHEPYHK